MALLNARPMIGWLSHTDYENAYGRIRVSDSLEDLGVP